MKASFSALAASEPNKKTWGKSWVSFTDTNFCFVSGLGFHTHHCVSSKKSRFFFLTDQKTEELVHLYFSGLDTWSAILFVLLTPKVVSGCSLPFHGQMLFFAAQTCSFILLWTIRLSKTGFFCHELLHLSYCWMLLVCWLMYYLLIVPSCALCELFVLLSWLGFPCIIGSEFQQEYFY